MKHLEVAILKLFSWREFSYSMVKTLKLKGWKFKQRDASAVVLRAFRSLEKAGMIEEYRPNHWIHGRMHYYVMTNTGRAAVDAMDDMHQNLHGAKK